jgi:saccharopine dehydrogenase-like NADP-dependent oxidoreductase
MEIAVLGGAGGIGRAVCEDLLKHSDVRVRIVDRRKEAAARLAEAFGPRATAVGADAGRQRTLTRALKGVAAAVNCIGPFYRFAVIVARTLLDAGVSGVDICDDYTPVRGLLALDDLARQRGLHYVTGVGWSPGLTNMLAVGACRGLDTIDRIDIRWVATVSDYAGPAALKHLLFTSTGDVPSFRNGHRISAAALSETEIITFPAPLGPVPVSHCGHPEPVTLPRYMAVNNVTVKGGLLPSWNNRAVRLAVAMGWTRDDRSIDNSARYIARLEKLFRLGSAALPRSGAHVAVSGWKAGQKKTLTRTVVDRMTRLTALPASVAVLQLTTGELGEAGVYAPEGCLNPDRFFTALARRGIVVEEEKQHAQKES